MDSSIIDPIFAECGLAGIDLGGIIIDNSYESESRSQSEDRIHRISMDINKGATIVDLIHLPTDEAILERLKSNRRLELMTMGEIEGALE